MLRRICLALSAALAVAITGPAAAQSLPRIEQEGLQPLATADQIRPFAAVGRLDTGDGFCTATLIAPDLVLTAAHCLFRPGDRARREDTTLIFNAGLRNGRVSARRGVAQSFVHPAYVYGAPNDLDRVRSDLALLRLHHPITGVGVMPLPARGAVRRGDEVRVVSYGEAREHVASLEEGCGVLASDPGVLVLSCSVVHGSSGAPVLVPDGTGYAVVSVVSAAAHWRDQPVALSAELEGEIDRLMALASAPPPARSAQGLPPVRQLGQPVEGLQGTTRGTAGARFVRP